MDETRILGAVLAGGRATRFGSDKALARMADGRTLIDHAVAGLAPHVAAVVICGREGGLPDRPASDMGPLGGLNAALHHALDYGFAGVLTTGCDMPFYPAALPAALIGESAAILKGQQLLGWWPATLASELDAHLAEENNRSIYGWIDRANARVVEIPGLVLPNINRPEDLAGL
ncbi:MULTISPECIES: molybdenum cofactor guanylyltransferase [Sphingobium]|uniref:Molybdopterin-guanine dinucleotide biosynthesis protein MobA n=2 Tax=Sphingobium cupriresistens TaxID=1132417 RepID=A0A0J7XXE2_9SPHN|nr:MULTISPECIES: molybdenum cofactor guanylyltransferase [Sphingobium]KMS55888.1 molybdopterin-guanine dinucleotide biosynthesis protein MobA [Sphingobium cupriresistens LL01]MBJ7377636.1 molybdenum cofactor guanylyltransferase [Sphingobium sp.]RYM13474.1 molybdenum cofactor guanylyltransferase [Sphingobium cupriresistens]